MKTFDARIGNLTNENAFLRILVNNATDHANNLKKLSDFLQSLLRDPNKYAEKALRAAEAYGNIVKAIEEVLKLAREANANSKIALDLVSLFFSSRDGLLGLQGGGGLHTSSLGNERCIRGVNFPISIQIRKGDTFHPHHNNVFEPSERQFFAHCTEHWVSRPW